MRRQFTESEWIQIRKSKDKREQLKTFYRLWVKKITPKIFKKFWDYLKTIFVIYSVVKELFSSIFNYQHKNMFPYHVVLDTHFSALKKVM